MVELERGKNEYSDGTEPCDMFGCVYCTDSGRCVYSVATIRQRGARACNEEERQAEIEARHDYEEGLL